MKGNLKLIFLTLAAVFTFASCDETSSSQNPFMKNTGMKDYFDSSDQILFKLYKKNLDGIVYWETWNNSDHSAIVHWGLLGDYGDKKI